MDKKKIYEFIDTNLKDKNQRLGTTSKKFKKDMVDFFDFPEARNFRCLELGFWRGHTSVILAQLFKEVSSMDINDGSKIIKDSDNFDNLTYYYPNDVYQDGTWSSLFGEKTFNVFFIDCIHDYEHFRQDMSRCMDYMDISQPVYFVVDDYGTTLNNNEAEAWDGSINLCVKNNILPANPNIEIVARIGLEKGAVYHSERKPLRDSEGIILKWEI